MNCRKAEKWLLRSLDARLDGRSSEALGKHLASCPACRKAAAEYRAMLSLLRDGRDTVPLAGFWDRLAPRLREETEIIPFLFWERWSLRAIPVFLLLVVLIGGFLWLQPQAGEINPSAALLLENRDPLSDTHALFDADKPETRSMMLMFASLEDRTSARRPTP